ncbi:MAG: cellulase family glycosylhydrolase [Planctomycetota bacterium]
MKTTCFLALLALCAAGQPLDAAELEWLTVSKDGQSFVGAASGARFVAWGFNYDRDYKSRLLEDYWETEWQTVAGDFREMKALGANVVRVHLQLARFMEGPEKPDRKALEQLGRLVVLAEQTGLYLDITGLGCYRKSAVPRWYNDATEEQRWAAQACFWEAVAECCAHSPAVFFYDLMNEPVVPSGKRQAGDWLTGELGGLCYVQFIALDQGGRARPEISRQWIARLVAAIRKHDSRHLISVGLLPDADGKSGFVPKEVAREVDFLCVHLYPDGAKPAEDLKTVEAFAVGKPLVIEETFLLKCTAGQLRHFIDASAKHVSGWLGFYWGRTPAQLRGSKDMGDALMLSWLELFQEGKPGK